MRSRILAHLGGTLRHHAGLMFITLLVITGCFFVSGSLLLTGQNLQKVLTLWGDSLQMSVYVKDDATDEQAQSLGEFLRKDRRIGKADWVDRDAALKGFQDQMASYAPDLLKDTQLTKFIPRSYQVQISDKVSAALQLDTLKDLARELKDQASVEDVTYGQEWVKTYSALTRTASKIGIWLITLLVAASIFVISNAISSSIQQRRSEIEVLELVGASKRFIRLPFLAEGLCVGLIAGAAALFLLAAGFSWLNAAFRSELGFLQLSHHLEFFSVSVILAFLGAAMLLGVLSAHFSLRRLNSGWAASARQGGAF